jgi:hypothetical protein
MTRQQISLSSPSIQFRGLYRTIDGAYVTNGMMAFHVPEADYRAFGYEPDFDRLPWKESYNAAKETKHIYAALDL